MRTSPARVALLFLLLTAGCADPPPIGTTEVAHAPITLPPIDATGGEGSVTIGGTEPFLAGDHETYELTFTVGASGLEAGGGLLMIDPAFHGVTMIKYVDWVTDPALCNDQYEEGVNHKRYEGLIWAEVDAPGVDVTVVRPEHLEDMHQDMYTEFTVSEAVPAGTVMTITLGEDGETPLGPAEPLCASRAPYRSFDRIDWRAASRFDAATTWAMLDEGVPWLQVRSATDLAETRVILPSFAQVGETIPVRVVLLDEYGNSLDGFAGSLVTQPDIDMPDLPHAMDISIQMGGVIEMEGTPDSEGVLRVEVSGTGGLSATSNPCVVSVDPPEQRLLWGDIHAHHGVSYLDEDGLLVNENLEYARHVAGLDFAAETMKLPPLEVDGALLWERLKQACAAYESADFVPMLAFEWMGPVGSGHHNVYYNGCTGGVTQSYLLDGLDTENGLWAMLDTQIAADPSLDAITVPHATKYTGYGWAPQHDGYRTAAETFSEWGSSMDVDGERSIPDGILAGNTMGLIASSDNHDGFMGNPLAAKNTRGGLIGVLVEERTRPAIFEAIQTRATLGTAIERTIALLSTEEEGYVARQGEEIVAFEPTFDLTLHGTRALTSATLYRIYLDGLTGVETAAEWGFAPGTMDAHLTFGPGDDGYALDGPAAFYLHVDEEDVGQAWTSPLYLYPDCGAGVDDPAGLCGADDDDDTSSDDDSADDDTADDDTGDDDTADDDTTGDDDDDTDCNCSLPPTRSLPTPLWLAVPLVAWAVTRRRR